MLLSHLRVVGIGSAAASLYCARRFAAFGAKVTMAGPAGGDPIRKAAPPTPADESVFAYLDFNKSVAG
jgi:crotonobetainyl-CoA:carnitine CoA-transferase CaiB-like acyl-CoA transferase